jgi:hypothetical protein
MGAPEGSIPRATTNWAGAKAAYRYFDNEAVKPEAIYKEHRRGVIRRAQGEAVVLAIGDTTQLSFSTHPNTTGLGPLEDESQNGLLIQPTLVVTPQRVPLGLVGQYIWVRDIENFRQSESKEAKNRPISEKESVKWLESFEASDRFGKDLAGSPTKVVAVFDREGDVVEVFQRAKRPGTASGLLVRATYDRRVDGEEKKRLWELMAQQPVSGTLTVAVPRKPGIKKREADLEIRFKEVTLLAPTYRKMEDRTPVSVFCVSVVEANPPEGVEPLEWMLFTTEEVASFERACEIVQWYTCRWMVERFFKTLKSGCKAEKRQLETAERLKRCLVFDCIVAWRILYLTTTGREVSNLPCTVAFEEHEWKGAWAFVHQTAAVPTETPTLQEMVRLVARLGGHLGRKQDKEPGEMTLWRGLQRLPDLGGMWLLLTGKAVPAEPTIDEAEDYLPAPQLRSTDSLGK